jgi:hypothetical protein
MPPNGTFTAPEEADRSLWGRSSRGGGPCGTALAGGEPRGAAGVAVVAAGRCYGRGRTGSSSASGPSGSVHSLTSTVRLPRDSMTRTVAPLRSGVGDQAIYVSEPPLILTSTSPGPAVPLVAMVRTPMQPMSEVSGATVSRPPASRAWIFGLESHSMPGRRGPVATIPPRKILPARGIARRPLPFLVIAGALCPPGRNYCLRGIPFGWSRVVPLAERRPRTSTGTPSRAECSGGVVMSAVDRPAARVQPLSAPETRPRT